MKPLLDDKDIKQMAKVLDPEGFDDPWAGDNGNWKVIVVLKGSEKPLEFGGRWSKEEVDAVVNRWLFDIPSRPEWYDRVKYFDKRRVTK